MCLSSRGLPGIWAGGNCDSPIDELATAAPIKKFVEPNSLLSSQVIPVFFSFNCGIA
jgi:hypothetical protein